MQAAAGEAFSGLPALTAEQNKALATTPADTLLSLPMLQLDVVTDPPDAYQISKRGNSVYEQTPNLMPTISTPTLRAGRHAESKIYVFRS